VCGEEIINERELERDGLLLCRSCAGEGYYMLAEGKHGHHITVYKGVYHDRAEHGNQPDTSVDAPFCVMIES
jgi:hypothetical protein